LVDAVLSFEGEGAHHFRILRAVKNRFGPTDEIGVFEMTGAGLQEVANPSALFLSERDLGAPGTAVFAGIEGTRPLLVEMQALVAPTTLGTPRRAVVGWDQNRLAMVLAVLEAHCGVRLSGHDVYLNVAGGLRIQEPAADLAAAAALVSSLTGAPLPSDAVYFGEISLSGTVRPVAQAAARLKEAAKLGSSASPAHSCRTPRRPRPPTPVWHCGRSVHWWRSWRRSRRRGRSGKAEHRSRCSAWPGWAKTPPASECDPASRPAVLTRSASRKSRNSSATLATHEANRRV
jgi:hypothetical protein